MLGRILAGFLFCSFLFAVGGNTQSTPQPQVRAIDEVAEKPVWTLEFVKIKPQKLGEALGYLDDDWMRVREEAKRQGAVLTYHRITEMPVPEPSTYKIRPVDTIVLITEYKNIAAYLGQQTLFASIRSHLAGDEPGVIKQKVRAEEVFESVDTRLFSDTPLDAGVGFKLLARQ